MSKHLNQWLRTLCLLCACTVLMGSMALAEHPPAKEDFYLHINGEWQDSHEIPADQMMIGGFGDLDIEGTKKQIALFNEALTQGRDAQQDGIGKMLAFYRMANDYGKRDELGLTPIAPYMTMIADAKDIPALCDAAWGIFPITNTFVTAYVMPDMKDSTKNALYFDTGNVTLPDKQYYDDSNPTGQMLMGLLTQGYAQMFALAGQTAEEAAGSAAQALEIEKRIAASLPSAEERSVITSMYNPRPFAEFDASLEKIDLVTLLEKIGAKAPEQVVVSWPAYYEALNALLTEENLPALKSYMLAQLLMQTSGSLNTQMLEISNQFQQAMTGVTTSKPLEEYAFYLASTYFSPEAGDLYVSKYFSAAAREDVIGMVRDLIDEYKRRIAALDWMSEDTRTQAAKKLDTMMLKIGYPDSYPDRTAAYQFTGYEHGGNLITNQVAIVNSMLSFMLGRIDQPVDKTEWDIPPQVVNAFYNPLHNEIVFPAAILQAPFYDPNRTRAENLGAIGVVIGHEITHAFDTNGSTFDEQGNIKDWWTDADRAAFADKTAALITQFDKATVRGRAVNGTLTISENIADLGGVSAALQVAQAEPDFDAKKFFTAYATQWRTKITPQMEEMLAATDVHAPVEARVNVVLPNFELFLTTYDIQEGDPMYRAPADRIQIW